MEEQNVEQESTKGDVAEMHKMGITNFYAMCEQKVRDKNAIIEGLKIEKENAWQQYIDDRGAQWIRVQGKIIQEVRTKAYKHFLLGCGLSSVIGWAIGHFWR